MFEYALLSIAAVVVAFQLWLTSRVWRSRLYEPRQKLLQAQLIWLLPLLGAGLVFHVLWEDTKIERKAARVEET